MISNEHNCACKPSAEATFCSIQSTPFPVQSKTSTHFLYSFSFASVFATTFTHFTLSFILFELLCVWLFLLFLFLVVKFPVLRVLLPATLLLQLMLWFTRCCRCCAVAVVPLFKMHSGILWKRNTIMGSYRAISHCVACMNMCYSVYFSIVCASTHANHVPTLATAISYWWSKLVAFVTLFYSFLPFSN